MDDLPIEARELLKLASDAHNPPSPEARARVRRGVAMAVGAGLGATIAGHAVAQGGVKAGVLSGLAGKLAVAGVVVAVASSVALTLPSSKPAVPEQGKSAITHHMRVKHGAELNVAAAPQGLETAPVPMVQPEQPMEPAQVAPAALPEADHAARMDAVTAPVPRAQALARHSEHSRHKKIVVPRRERASQPMRVESGAPTPGSPPKVAPAAPSTAADALRAEMALLSQASQALSRGDLATAEQALMQHRQTFRTSVLAEERDGLTALLRCSVDPGQGKALAARFVGRAPKSVLAKRVARACKLGDEP